MNTPTHIKHLAHQLHRSGTGQASSDAADCARSKGPGGFFKDLLGALGLLTLLATAWTVAESLDTPAPEPECRKQWTSDSRYVRHCNHFNGRGWVVTP